MDGYTLVANGQQRGTEWTQWRFCTDDMDMDIQVHLLVRGRDETNKDAKKKVDVILQGKGAYLK